MTPVFAAKKRISEREARNLIVAMAIHGNHYNDLTGSLKAVANIKDHFAQSGQDFHKAVLECRNFSKPVPMYENLIGPQWVTKGIAVSRPSHIDGELKTLISDDGSYNESDYWASFEIAREDFEQALLSGRYERYLAAVNAGLAAIEAFLNHQFMSRMKFDETALELRHNLDYKIDTWSENLTGRRFDKSTSIWGTFVELRKLRDEHFQHRKSLASGITHKELLKLINKFKKGIAGLLYELHVHFNVRCPSKIIRHVYFPEIELANP